MVVRAQFSSLAACFYIHLRQHLPSNHVTSLHSVLSSSSTLRGSTQEAINWEVFAVCSAGTGFWKFVGMLTSAIGSVENVRHLKMVYFRIQ